MIKIDHLVKLYGSFCAVDDVSFEVHKGEVFGLVGESGCGKTTTGRSIIRLYDITGGSVYYKGQRICAGTRSYKDAIKKAIKDMGMTWDHMSDVKYWDCEGAKLYGVNSIPATVLVAQDGTIVARNVRGAAIKEKLAELLK